MIWARVSSQSCFCWPYSASPSLIVPSEPSLAGMRFDSTCNFAPPTVLLDHAEAWPWGATPRPRSGCDSSGAAAKKSYHRPKGRGSGLEEQPHLQGAAAAGRRRPEKSYSTFKVRRGRREKIPLLQGKEQQLHFVGAAIKRYPTSEVRETQVRR